MSRGLSKKDCATILRFCEKDARQKIDDQACRRAEEIMASQLCAVISKPKACHPIRRRSSKKRLPRRRQTKRITEK
jgi:hypothetical protein